MPSRPMRTESHSPLDELLCVPVVPSAPAGREGEGKGREKERGRGEERERGGVHT